MGESREELEATIVERDAALANKRAEAESVRDSLVSAIAAKLQVWVPQYVESRVREESSVTKALGNRVSELKADVNTLCQSIPAKNAEWFNTRGMWPHREDFHGHIWHRPDFNEIDFQPRGSQLVRRVLADTFVKLLANMLGRYGYKLNAELFTLSEVTVEFNLYAKALRAYEGARDASTKARSALESHEASVLWDKA